MKHKEIYTDFVVFLTDYLLSPNCVVRFSANFTDSKMGMLLTLCKSLKKFLCAKLEICNYPAKVWQILSQEEIWTFCTKLYQYLVPRRISVDPNIRFS